MKGVEILGTIRTIQKNIPFLTDIDAISHLLRTMTFPRRAGDGAELNADEKDDILSVLRQLFSWTPRDLAGIESAGHDVNFVREIQTIPLGTGDAAKDTMLAVARIEALRTMATAQDSLQQLRSKLEQCEPSVEWWKRAILGDASDCTETTAAERMQDNGGGDISRLGNVYQLLEEVRASASYSKTVRSFATKLTASRTRLLEQVLTKKSPLHEGVSLSFLEVLIELYYQQYTGKEDASEETEDDDNDDDNDGHRHFKKPGELAVWVHDLLRRRSLPPPPPCSNWGVANDYRQTMEPFKQMGKSDVTNELWPQWEALAQEIEDAEKRADQVTRCMESMLRQLFHDPEEISAWETYARDLGKFCSRVADVIDGFQ